MYVIQDDIHCEQIGSFASREAALTELRRLASIPWHDLPNLAPCTSWRTCGRRYVLLHFDEAVASSDRDQTLLSREFVLEIRADGVGWAMPFHPAPGAAASME